LAKKQAEENKIYQYLKTNTLLFTQKEKPPQEEKRTYHFSPKSIPWYIGEVYMLERINQQKELRRKALNIEAKKNMLKQWKDLPDAVRNTNIFSTEEIFNEDVHSNKQRQPHFKAKEVPDFKSLQKEFA
jgi:hypothetical protein